LQRRLDNMKEKGDKKEPKWNFIKYHYCNKITQLFFDELLDISPSGDTIYI
jgi:hypothetical protein